MRIGLFHSTLPEPKRKIGGVEQFVHRLGNALVEAGHDVVVWTLTSRPADARYRVRTIGSPALLRNRARRLLEVPLLLQQTSFEDRDVLHLHGDDWFFVRRELPTVRTLHGSALYEARYATSMRRRIAQSLVFPAEVLASRLATLSFAVGPGMPPAYRVNGVLSGGFDITPLHLPRSKRPSILFVGTWEGRKRGRFLASEFVRVRRQVPDAELWMVSDRAELAENIRLIRYPTDQELRLLYARAWVFCLPSSYEGFGMPYVEAMTQGTPVVATANPGSRETLAQGGGEIVDDAALVETLISLLTDDERRGRLSNDAMAASSRFRWEPVVAKHEAAYKRAIQLWRS